MDLALSDDQVAILDAVDTLSKPYAWMPADCRRFVLQSPELDRALAEGGFLDVAYDEELGPLTAALIVERLARLPFTVEAAASALVRPLFGESPGPFCLVDAASAERPLRFLAPGATVIVLDRTSVASFAAEAGNVEPVESLFAYPMARLVSSREAKVRVHGVSADLVRARWRVALAAEMAGLMGAAIDSTVTYVSERQQFGRPIGVFQAVRHRLAEASVRANGSRWLAFKAAYSGDLGDAALAAHHAQDSAAQIIYDLHQFLGGMGMTLEHPLHLWTYRLKALLSEMGGAQTQAVAAADLLWPASAA